MTPKQKVSVLLDYADQLKSRMLRGEKRTPEHTYELLNYTADVIVQECGLPETDPKVISVRRSASLLTPMFGDQADTDWLAFRKALPWGDRLLTSKTPSPEYRAVWSQRQRQAAIDELDQLIRDAEAQLGGD